MFKPEKIQSCGDHNHQSVMTEINKINKELNQLKDNLVSTSGMFYNLVVCFTGSVACKTSCI
jgi:hypothetical protein